MFCEETFREFANCFKSLTYSCLSLLTVSELLKLDLDIPWMNIYTNMTAKETLKLYDDLTNMLTNLYTQLAGFKSAQVIGLL